MQDPNPDCRVAKTFVLVHGAWHGGWCWARVAQRLLLAGHRVYAPTLTGLGERSHLLRDDITLQTFVDDIVNVLRWEDLQDVVLVGHSFGGLVISGVADVAAERIRQLVFLDAFVLPSGVATFDTLPIEVVAKLHAASQQVSATVPVLAPPKPKTLGLLDPNDVSFVADRLTPQPLKTYQTALSLQHPLGNGLPCTYIDCVNPSFPAVEDSRQWVKTHTDWQWKTLDAGHGAMVSAPGLLAEMLSLLSTA